MFPDSATLLHGLFLGDCLGEIFQTLSEENLRCAEHFHTSVDFLAQISRSQWCLNNETGRPAKSYPIEVKLCMTVISVRSCTLYFR